MGSTTERRVYDECRTAVLKPGLSAAWAKSELGLRGEGFVHLPATPLEQLGDVGFMREHGVLLPYMAGAMANGIASVELVEALQSKGILAVFGSAGLAMQKIAAALDRLASSAPRRAFGANLIHAPQDPKWEDALVDLLLARSCRLVEASAFLRLTPAIVRYRLTGIYRATNGDVVAPNRVIAKVSRPEVAIQFLSPAPPEIVASLLSRRLLTPAEAELAPMVPMADDLTAEADSGGHTDNRAALALLPTMLTLATRMSEKHGFKRATRVGAAGGIGSPQGAFAAFAMGASYVVTGSINQACIEAGTSDLVRQKLAEATSADVAMAPAADMFEMGVRVQVLKRGTMFPMRAAKLFELYSRHRGLDDLPAADVEMLTSQVFQEPLDRVWLGVKRYFAERDPSQTERAERDPRHKMALVFRSYLGRASHWANQGEAARAFDFQVWCGPAIGAFNAWTQHSPLAAPTERRVADVAMNLMLGAAVAQRAQILRCQGVRLMSQDADWRPLVGLALERAMRDAMETFV